MNKQESQEAFTTEEFEAWLFRLDSYDNANRELQEIDLGGVYHSSDSRLS